MGLPTDFTHLVDPTHSDFTLSERLQYNAQELEKLLELWTDCPTQIRSTLSPGVAQLSELSNEAAKYEEVRYPHIFFQHLCSAAILITERGEVLDDGSKSSLLTAWTSVQLSIHLTNDPSLNETLDRELIGALEETIELLICFIKYRAEQKDKPQEWKLALDIQKSSCRGTLATLQMLRHWRTKENLASTLQDLDQEIQSFANRILYLHQAARSEKTS